LSTTIVVSDKLKSGNIIGGFFDETWEMCLLFLARSVLNNFPNPLVFADETARVLSSDLSPAGAGVEALIPDLG